MSSDYFGHSQKEEEFLWLWSSRHCVILDPWFPWTGIQSRMWWPCRNNICLDLFMGELRHRSCAVVGNKNDGCVNPCSHTVDSSHILLCKQEQPCSIQSECSANLSVFNYVRASSLRSTTENGQMLICETSTACIHSTVYTGLKNNQETKPKYHRLW